MTLIDTYAVVYDRDGRARVPASSERPRTRESFGGPSGASGYRTVLPTRVERALMGTIGRPWA